jgi:acid stress chaperone HdeB
MKFRYLIAGIPLLVVCPLASPAQVTIDVSKITCKQFLIDQVAPTKSIVLWLSGYYNGLKANTVIDAGTLRANADKVSDYCRMNLDETVMKAVEATLGVSK